MYKLISKLKSLKKDFRELNLKEFYNISDRVKIAWEELMGIQKELGNDPFNDHFIQEEKVKVAKLANLSKVEEYFAKQKSNIKWLR